MKTILLMLPLLLAGCLSRPVEVPPIFFTTSEAVAEQLMINIVSQAPLSRTWTRVAPSHSMSPILTGGEFLILAPWSPGQPLRAGQFIVFTDRQGRRIIHPILAVNAHSFIAYGLNNTRPDDWLPLSAIEAICTGIVTYPTRDNTERS